MEIAESHPPMATLCHKRHPTPSLHKDYADRSGGLENRDGSIARVGTFCHATKVFLGRYWRHQGNFRTSIKQWHSGIR